MAAVVAVGVDDVELFAGERVPDGLADKVEFSDSIGNRLDSGTIECHIRQLMD